MVDPDEPIGSVVFHKIRRIIEHHQDWWYKREGEAVIGDTFPVAMEIMNLVDRHYVERHDAG